MTTPSHDTIWLTRAVRDQLEAEYAELGRVAAPGPEIDARIRDLRSMLKRSEVGHKPDDGLVEAGMTITVVFDDDQESTTFLLAERAVPEIDDSVGLEVYSPRSPLGTAINGKYPGDVFQYIAPSGREISGTISSASPFIEPV